MKHKEMYTDFVVFLPDYLISPNCVKRFPHTLQIETDTAKVCGNLYALNLRFHLKYKEIIYQDFAVFLPY